jgi:3-hydroxyisobutyrate dehydrogenase
MKRVTFLGLGLMGNAMARRLLEHGFELTVWNRNASRADALVKAGAKLAATPAEGARGAEVVIAMLADDEASRAVWLGDSGALAAMDRGAIAVDSSTLTVECMRELGAVAAARGVDFLDAPVTGSKPQAEQGALRFLIGGDAAAVKRAAPVFAAMSREQVHLGPAGSGALLKLINNFLCGVQLASLGEAIAMAQRSGLDIRRTADILAAGSPGSPIVKMVVERMVTRDYTPNFLVPLMVKDLTYVIQTFAAQGIDLADAHAARERFMAAAAAGFENQDIAAVVEPMRRDR